MWVTVNGYVGPTDTSQNQWVPGKGGGYEFDTSKDAEELSTR